MTDADLEFRLDAFMKMTPREMWLSMPAQDKLSLLSFWGMRPGWQPPECVLSAWNTTYTTTTRK